MRLFFYAIQFTLISLVLASQSAFAGSQFNLTPGVTPISHDIFDLHMTIFWICVVIGIVVFGFMGYAILFHRKSSGRKPAVFHEHLWLEITWTLIPTLILIGMAIPASLVLIHINDTTTPAITIKITGYQWKWRYEYIDQGINFFSNSSTPYKQLHGLEPKTADYLRMVDKPLVVPIHQKIRFLITSNDVIHSWWVPDFGVKRDAIPGFINESWTRINRPGTYYGQCAELCGINHAYMPIVVIALAEKDFAAWVMQQKNPSLVVTPRSTTAAPASVQPTAAVAAAASPHDVLMQKGEEVYLNTCAVCHKPDGSGMPPTFPALKGSKTTTGPRDQHFHTVIFGKPGTAMQPFKDQLSEEEIAAVITYERNAWGNNTGDTVLVSEIKQAKGSPP